MCAASWPWATGTVCWMQVCVSTRWRKGGGGARTRPHLLGQAPGLALQKCARTGRVGFAEFESLHDSDQALAPTYGGFLLSLTVEGGFDYRPAWLALPWPK